jgi:hypothetical protein
VSGKFIRDSADRVVILRGVTTITRDNTGQPMVMRPEDFQRIKAWGYNVQQIRLEACKMGLIPPCKPDSAYLDLVESWVRMGAQHGIYSIFKATLYDVPGYQFQFYFRPATWDRFWDPGSGIQDAYLRGWQLVWKRFANDPTVIGYDYLNEPIPASNTPDFSRRYLFPFYRKAAEALHSIDPQKVLFYQPNEEKPEDGESLKEPNVVFAPHFYPPPREGISDAMDKRVHSSAAVDAPVMIGEYGYPNVATRNLPAATQERDVQDANLMDQWTLGTIKTWYTSHGDFAILQPNGKANPRIAIFSRPYPQRVAGTPESWHYDFAGHSFTLRYKPDPAIKEPTRIYVAPHNYPSGFDVSTSDGLQFSSGGNAVAGISYEPETQTLLVLNPAQSSGVREIKVKQK